VQFRVTIPGLSLYPGDEKHWWEGITSEDMVRIAQRADELGYDYLGVPEHVVMHDDWVGVMGPRWVHCTTAMAFLAGATKRIKLAGVVVVPYHNPIELAKSFSTIDFMSGGRLVVVGLVGYMDWEYQLLDAPPFAERGAVMDEYMDAMIELWTSDRPSFEGKYVQFANIAFEPKPVQDPLPIWLGGYTRASLRRVARIAEGWVPWAITRAQVSSMVAEVRERPEFRERPRKLELFMNLFEGEIDPDTHRVVAPPKVVMERDAILEQLHQLAAIGVTVTDANPVVGGGVFGSKGRDAAPPPQNADEFVERLHWFAEEVFPEGKAI
jgi:probable F420-dependent oxidoreductase